MKKGFGSFCQHTRHLHRNWRMSDWVTTLTLMPLFTALHETIFLSVANRPSPNQTVEIPAFKALTALEL